MEGLVSNFFRHRVGNGVRPEEDPFAGELYSPERLESFAALLASEQKTSAAPGPGKNLLSRLEDNGRVLARAYHVLAETVRRERAVAPAAGWLVDNFHLVEEQLREIREDLPKAYQRELPKLTEGEYAGYPRVYAIAVAFLTHTDSTLDPEVLRRFVVSYQRDAALSTGELWALPIGLRLALVENLRRYASRMVRARRERERADALADRVLELAAQRPERLTRLIAEAVTKNEQPVAPFVVQLTRRLRDQDPAVASALDWLGTQLAQHGRSTEQLIQQEHQQQAAAQVAVANIITSMRLLSTLDWRDFFEAVSPVEALLRQDPAGAYAGMDFPTRDRYRHVIERISAKGRVPDTEVAHKTVWLADQAVEGSPPGDLRTHVGYYLIGRGRAELEKAFAYVTGPREWAERVVRRRPTIIYLGALGLLTGLVLALLLLVANRAGAGSFTLVVFGLLSLVPASELALGLLNWAVTSAFKPVPLPKMETAKGLPADARTMVVVPTLLTDADAVREQVEKMEVQYLAGRDDNLYFALLGDFADAPRERMETDDALLEEARAQVALLNSRHDRGEGEARFFLFHRRRLWNPAEGKWMGWERKRGKLEEFNRLLRGAEDTSYMVATASAEFLSRVRYVITLDSDTQLPRDAARRLVGTILHPLNRPRFDAGRGRVVEGYGVLQPRIGISLTSASRSRFARIFSGNVGVDPYTTAVSDVYQDLFGEGNYTGKGLYDVDAFTAALKGRVPENAVLSHDLFEGLFARAALVTDIELLDDYPSQYDTSARRQHRWTRGDWQLPRWLLPRVPDESGRLVPNPLPPISRWKILDNLRRSLTAPTTLLWLLTAWAAVPGSPVLWTVFGLLPLAFPIFVRAAELLVSPRRVVAREGGLRGVWADAVTRTAQAALNVTFLAHQAYLMADAIVRALYRVLVSRRHLLEWVPASQAGLKGARDLIGFFRFMWTAPVLAGLGLLVVLPLRPSALGAAALILLAWAASPLVAYWTSLRGEVEREPLAAADVAEARLIARLTWRFFETFVGEEDHWLPPDNYQEDPAPLVAHRTSPTNIGLYLLSNVAAHDLGYMGSLELVERMELTFTTLERLQRYRGHFLNWYDTVTLEPLAPQYVSTVDSGNLAGHLLAVRQACLDLPGVPIVDGRQTGGLTDTLAQMRAEAEQLAREGVSAEWVPANQLVETIEECERLLANVSPAGPAAWRRLLERVAGRLDVIEDIVQVLEQEHGTVRIRELRFWVGSFSHQTLSFRRDMQTLAPWTDLLAERPSSVCESCPPEIEAEWRLVETELGRVLAPSDIPARCDSALLRLAALRGLVEQANPRDFDGRERLLEEIGAVTAAVEGAAVAAKYLLARTASLARVCERIVDEMDFHFLFDEGRKVLTIGYNVTDDRRDNAFYDLLASEARLAGFMAVATGDVPEEHWFSMSRPVTAVAGRRVLVSWSGSMFEYLMPLLIMRSYADTLLDQTYTAAVARQIAYGRERGVPWGVSESAYNARDLQLNYQYAPFGVPGLGLKRGLSEQLVVAPYATVLAAMVEPGAALRNMRRLKSEGALGAYGFYEAIDYTPERLPGRQNHTVVRAHMAHHQGMSLVALDNLLNDFIMQRRFHAESRVRATELLLQERASHAVTATFPRSEEVRLSRQPVREQLPPASRKFETADFPTPRTQLLSNGTYTVMVTTAGAGFSKCGPLAVTRWREDAVRDHWGSFCYLRDVRSGAVWSAGYQPTLRAPRSYEVTFSEDKAEITRGDVGLLTHTEIVVSPEDDTEVRRVSVTNQSARVREVELTSYAEVVLSPQARDSAHPAFSNLFVETEFVAEENALMASRRPRSPAEAPIWAVHTVVAEGETVGAVQYETDRARFTGRGRTTADPVAVMEGRPLSNTVGAVLDPVFSLRQRVLLKPQETARVTFALTVARTREEALALADKYHDAGAFDRTAKLAWTRARVEMSHFGMDAGEAHLFQRLAARILYCDPSLRPRPHVLALNTGTQSGLWGYGISGDLPIVLVRVGDARDLDAVRRLLRGHEYLRLKGLAFDLVVLNEHPASYIQPLQDEILSLVRKSGSHALTDQPGGVFLRRADQMPDEDRILLHTVARVVLVAERGPLEEQLLRKPVEAPLPPPFIPRWPSLTYPEPHAPTPEMKFFNGLGGFSPDGREYITALGRGQWTPAPWLNVIANKEGFGFLVSEAGSGCSWSVNSRENRLTPWSNDAVSDPPGEVVYLRDEDTGRTWTTTPLPVREASPYTVRHGQGYTVFEHTSHGIAQELLMFAPTDAPVKVSRLRMVNLTERKRRLSATYYVELILGAQREASAPFVITGVDQTTGAVFARNPYNNEFADRVAFVEMSEGERTLTCDRQEFIGRNGSLTSPAALRRTHLSGRAGAGLDPCVAMQAAFELAPGETRELVMLLGEGESVEEARSLVTRFRQLSTVKDELGRARKFWDDLLGVVEVRTPDAALNVMMNRWLPYQTLSCRVWGRTAAYQSGGAYGFRDQLQDVSALVYARPDLARAHLLRAAARQFWEGDVQHWWHPPTGRGVRTRCSDDLLWLPYVTSLYVEKTGDASVLDEVVPFIEAPPLEPGQDESYQQPAPAEESATLYEHCARALDRGLVTGAHGLPLIGTGDWNDGMNLVGHEGRGESVWLGWFLYAVLGAFIPACESRGDTKRAARYRKHTNKLRRALEESAWDSDWYLRAFFDDGTPLGSARNDECRIDSISQSWGVISGAANPARAARAMSAVEQHLVRRDEGLVMLLTPPFHKSALEPGYIKGYVPGVRENGGQYTHAALWAVIAYALLGDGDRAGELLALLNPVSHGSTRAGLHKYKVEPYVVAADIYAVPPHTGRGGWTWYTGSAAWMYRSALEYVLGFRLRGERLRFEPCIPRGWREFEITYRRGRTLYHIKVENPGGVCCKIASVEADGEPQRAAEIVLADDGQAHQVRVILGEASPAEKSPEAEHASEGALRAQTNTLQNLSQEAGRGRRALSTDHDPHERDQSE